MIPPDESTEAFVETARRTRPATLQRIMAEVGRAPLPAGLDQVQAPTLAVAGTRDTRPARRALSHLQSTMPRAVGYLVPGVGHQWNAEQPQLFTDVVRQCVTDLAVDPRLVAVEATSPASEGRKP